MGKLSTKEFTMSNIDVALSMLTERSRTIARSSAAEQLILHEYRPARFGGHRQYENPF
jgi:hypothetical protein